MKGGLRASMVYVAKICISKYDKHKDITMDDVKIDGYEHILGIKYGLKFLKINIQKKLYITKEIIIRKCISVTNNSDLYPTQKKEH